MTEFTPLASLLGGVLLGLSAALVFLFCGRIVGISGMLAGLLEKPRPDHHWRAAFIAGLLVGGFMMVRSNPALFEMALDRSTVALMAAGLLVGFGTQLGNGCTSGHGICGVSRVSPRSLVATGIFVAAGMLVATGVRILLGGSV